MQKYRKTLFSIGRLTVELRSHIVHSFWRNRYWIGILIIMPYCDSPVRSWQHAAKSEKSKLLCYKVWFNYMCVSSDTKPQSVAAMSKMVHMLFLFPLAHGKCSLLPQKLNSIPAHFTIHSCVDWHFVWLLCKSLITNTIFSYFPFSLGLFPRSCWTCTKRLTVELHDTLHHIVLNVLFQTHRRSYESVSYDKKRLQTVAKIRCFLKIPLTE